MRDAVDRRSNGLSFLDPAALLTNIMENAAIGFVMMTLEGRVLHANRAFCAMLGFTETELLITGIDHLIHPDDRNATHGTFHSFLAGEAKGYQLERRYIRRDGRFFMRSEPCRFTVPMWPISPTSPSSRSPTSRLRKVPRQRISLFTSA